MSDLLLTNDYQDPTLAVLNCERATLKVAGQELNGYLHIDANVNKVIGLNLSQVAGLVGKLSRSVLDFHACSTGQSVAAQESSLFGNFPYVLRVPGQSGKLPRLCSPVFAAAYWQYQSIKGNKLAQALVFVITAEKVNQAARSAFHLDQPVIAPMTLGEMLIEAGKAALREEALVKEKAATALYLADKPIAKSVHEAIQEPSNSLPGFVSIRQIREKLSLDLPGDLARQFSEGVRAVCHTYNFAMTQDHKHLVNFKGALKLTKCNGYSVEVLEHIPAILKQLGL